MTCSMTRIGISGHQSRPGIDWEWTGDRITDVLIERAPIARAFSCLAAGSDQIFAQRVLAVDIPVTAVIPLPRYERFFKEENLAAYEALLARCEAILLPGSDDSQRAFFDAGLYVVDSVDLLVAVWDGRPAAGLGGTADVVGYCISRKRPVIHINPIDRTVCTVGPT